VPFIACWHGKIKPGTVNNHISAFWDFLPTAADIANTELADDTDGISYMPTLLGKEQKKHEYLYWEFKQNNIPMQAVRMRDWKAVKLDSGAIQLYNLKDDIAEAFDLAEKHQELVDKIETIMRTARKGSKEFPLFD